MSLFYICYIAHSIISICNNEFCNNEFCNNEFCLSMLTSISSLIHFFLIFPSFLILFLFIFSFLPSPTLSLFLCFSLLFLRTPFVLLSITAANMSEFEGVMRSRLRMHGRRHNEIIRAVIEEEEVLT